MAKKAPPAFQFYASDWLGSTRIALMTSEQEGAYIRLLAHAWADEDCSIPADDKSLAVLSRLGGRWAKHGRQILDCFEPHPALENRLVNRKLHDVQEFSHEMSRRGAIGGKRSANIRWGYKQDGKQDGKQRLTVELPSTGKPPTPTPKKPPIVPLPGDVFSRFWSAYPRRIARGAAERAWTKINPDADLAAQIIAAVTAQAAGWTDPKFIPHPASWLNGKRWEDETAVTLPTTERKLVF